MKKSLYLVLLILMSLSLILSGCGNSEPSTDQSSSEESSQQSSSEVSSEVSSQQSSSEESSSSEQSSEESSEQSSSEASSVESSQPSSQAAQESKVESTQPSSAATGGASPMDTYLLDAKTATDAINQMFDGAINVSAAAQDNNTVVMTYAILDNSLGFDQAAIEDQASRSSNSVARMIERMKECGIESPSIIVRWIDIDGTELFNQQYN